MAWFKNVSKEEKAFRKGVEHGLKLAERDLQNTQRETHIKEASKRFQMEKPSLEEAYMKGFDDGRTKGSSEDRTPIYRAGYQAGEVVGYNRGKQEAGSSNDRKDEIVAAYNRGKQEGETNGYNRGKREGESAGYNRGYQEGRRAGGQSRGSSVSYSDTEKQMLKKFYRQLTAKFHGDTKDGSDDAMKLVNKLKEHWSI